MKNLFVIAMLTFSAAIGQAENRITGPADVAKRCTANIPSTAQCVENNQKETDSGCITPEERDTLNGYAAFAQCTNVTVRGETVRVLSGWCACGCFSNDTRMAVSDKVTGLLSTATAWETARNRTKLNLITLNESLELGEAFTYQHTPIALAAAGPEKKSLVVIHTDLGHKLSVTRNHPVVRSDFKMVQASRLKVGDELLDQNGARTKIVKITKEKAKDPVVNFVTTAASDIGHVIFAEGLTVGDMKWQAMLSDEAKAIDARR